MRFFCCVFFDFDDFMLRAMINVHDVVNCDDFEKNSLKNSSKTANIFVLIAVNMTEFMMLM